MHKDNKVCAIIQARLESSRLPRKVLLPLGEKTVLEVIVERLRKSKTIDDVIVATTNNVSDDEIADLGVRKGITCFRGSEQDVLSRVLGASIQNSADIIVEITADCPFIDYELINHGIRQLCLHNYEYVSNVIERTFARGLDFQVFWTKTLKRVDDEVDNPIDRQHVSTWIYRNPKSYKDYFCGKIRTRDYDTSDIRLTLDTVDDYNLIKAVYKHFNNQHFGYKDLYKFFKKNSDLKYLNAHIPQKSYEDELIGWYENHDKI